MLTINERMQFNSEVSAGCSNAMNAIRTSGSEKEGKLDYDLIHIHSRLLKWTSL